jgi:hypothetical protein
MEDFFLPPIILNYERDPVDDTLYNISSSSFLQNFTSLYPKSHEQKARSLLIDENGRQWTKFSFQFYFHIYDEDRCNNFETILLENNYYHTRLTPKITFQKLVIDGKCCDRNSKNSLPFSSLSPQTLSDSKPMRAERREILLKYSVSLGAVALPLSQFYHLTSSFPATSQSLTEATILNSLIRSQLSDITSLLSLFSMMANSLNEIHCQGLCHCQLTLGSFLLYSPSSGTTDDQSMEWGVQMMAHWLYVPCGPSDPSISQHHFAPSQPMVTPLSPFTQFLSDTSSASSLSFSVIVPQYPN